MANRGTKQAKPQGRVSNWTGKDFKKYVKEYLKNVDDDETISINRGTGRAFVSDIKKKARKETKPKYISTGRGTKRVRVNQKGYILTILKFILW